MKWTWKTELPLLFLLAAMFVLAATTWSSAPDRIPVHWNISGEVDRYGSRFEGLVMVPGVGLLIYVLMLFLPRLDPGRANYDRFASVYYILRASVLAVIAVVYGVIHLWIRGTEVDVGKVVGISVGALFFVIGNLFGKIRPNWFVGMRTPWTLSSKLAWTRTHRAAGWVLIAGGIAIMAAAILATPAAVYVAGAVLFGGLTWATLYSYLVWRKDPDRIHPAGTRPGD